MKPLEPRTRVMLAMAARADSAPRVIRERAQQRLLQYLAAGTVTTSAIAASGAELATLDVAGVGSVAGTSAAVTSSSSLVAAAVTSLLVGLSTGLLVLSLTNYLGGASSSLQPPEIGASARSLASAVPAHLVHGKERAAKSTESSSSAKSFASTTLTIAREPPTSTPQEPPNAVLSQQSSTAVPWLAPSTAVLSRERATTVPSRSLSRAASQVASAAAFSNVVAPDTTARASIARETALLAEVQRELAAGKTQLALMALARHTEEFPHGALHEEATASRVVALCALGRVEEGQRWAIVFAQRYPASPLLRRVRRACPVDKSDQMK